MDLLISNLFLNKFLTSGSGRNEYVLIWSNARIYMCKHVHLNNYTLPSPGRCASPLATGLYHLGSYETGGEAIQSYGMMDSLLKVTNLLFMTNFIMIFWNPVPVPPVTVDPVARWKHVQFALECTMHSNAHCTCPYILEFTLS